VSAVRFTKRAREDLFDIWLYIAPRHSEAFADEIYDRIEARCQALREYPEMGRTRPEISEGARSLVIERWLALYRLVEDGVQIVRIVDGSRDLTNLEWSVE
jgi:toxin ParE1/3/4